MNWTKRLLLALGLLVLTCVGASAQGVLICYQIPGLNCQAVSSGNPLPVSASVSASISGFTATSTGTPISVTSSGVTGTLPAGAVVVATNVGATNGAYCALGASATTSSQYLSPGGGWFAFTVGASTQLTCITSTSTTTVNMTGGTGLPTGTGGGGGGGSSSNASVSSTGAAVPASATYLGINTSGNLVGWDGSIKQATAASLNATVVGTGTFATQSAVTAASGAYASGSIASGAVASGAYASGSIADGAEVTIGAKADAKNAATDTTAITIMQVMKEISSLEQAPVSRAVTNAGTFATQSAVTAASGSIASGAIASGALAPGSIASGAVASGAFASGSIASGALVSGADVTEGTTSPTITCSTTWTVNGCLSQIDADVKGPIAAQSTHTVNIGAVDSISPYPATAVPVTASATGSTTATTATLTNVTGHTTYICGFSIRANAAAAATNNATVTGVITGTMNFTQWTAPNASGLGVTEEVFSPCIPASAVSTSIAVVSGAPGTSGVVSVSAWGYSI